MKVLALHEANGPASARMENADIPSPQAGEVRVALRAASFNHRELWIARGQYPGMKLPCILGADGAGVIDAVGEGVDPGQIGRSVVLYPGLGWGNDERFPDKSFGLLGMPGPGTMAEFICVPEASACAKPEYLSFEEAAAFPTGALTAFRGLTVKAGLQPGENILITGIGGGVASFALQFACAMGANAFVTSSSDATNARAVAMGAKAGFNYRDDAWRKDLAKASGGIDVVFDGAPASAYAGYQRALRFGARVVMYGSTGGAQVPVSAPDLFLRHATILGTAMGSPRDFQAMLDFVTQHQIHPVIDRSFALAQADEALLYVESGHQFGKVTVTI